MKLKLKLKLIAIASALASLAGTAHAGLTPAANQQNGTFALVAFDLTGTSYYVRDLGFFLNTFLPSGVTPNIGEASQVPGNKTPSTGLLLNASNTAGFATDANFSTWLGTVSSANVRWFAGAWDNVGTNPGFDTRRLIATSANPNETFSSTDITNWTGAGASSNFGGIVGLTGAFGTSIIRNNKPTPWNTQFGLITGGTNPLGTLGSSSSLFYASTGENDTANGGPIRFGNVGNFATLTLGTNGDLTYSLAPEAVAAVPLPAAAWLMGAGLIAMGGVIRRRKAAAAQA